MNKYVITQKGRDLKENSARFNESNAYVNVLNFLTDDWQETHEVFEGLHCVHPIGEIQGILTKLSEDGFADKYDAEKPRKEEEPKKTMFFGRREKKGGSMLE